ncbi:J domain-containing protein [Ilumatobacter sp.]|uniref:J domain-containing protein n=1 Tax=Ilumatobacter sp. TaxID=1967498 RepID=UPI003B52896B
MNGRSHYDVLGVSPSATPEAVREAYRRLAREFHPDRTHGSAVGAERMPSINEAYRVLSDPARRAVYDADRRAEARPRPGPAAPRRMRADADADEGDRDPSFAYGFPDGPARVPWRGLLFASALAIVAIVVLAQFTEPGEPSGPDGILRNGDCVEIMANNDAREIACTGTDDLVVRQFITPDATCSTGYTRYRDRQGMGYACVAEESSGTSTG